ncbi:alpha/beta fold hydrolase [Brucellaceae bacterium D45D]
MRNFPSECHHFDCPCHRSSKQGCLKGPYISTMDVPNGSLASDLARLTGRTIFILDARGYGQSDRPTAMDHPPHAGKPLSRAYEVIRDIDAVAAIARQRTGVDQVALLGWKNRRHVGRVLCVTLARARQRTHYIQCIVWRIG